MTNMIALLIPIAAGVWVGMDASKRGMNSWGWGIGTFLLLIIVLPVYFFTRKPLVNNQEYQLEDDILDKS